jgi:hypothetical protein
MTPLSEFLAQQQKLIDAALDRLTPSEIAEPVTIHKAMRYSLFAGGKRIRPILCLQAAAAVSDWAPGAMEAACSLEMVHTYSLIHDDLPALDNDDYRRGKPTCHKVFGEAMAVLAGDGLLTLAMQTLSAIPDLAAESKVHLLRELAFASGTVNGSGPPPNCSTGFIAPRPERCCGQACAWAGSAPAPMNCSSRRFRAMANMPGSRSRLWMTCLMWRNRPRLWAKRRGRTPHRAKSHFRRSMGLSDRAGWLPKNACARTRLSSRSETARGASTRLPT